ncbi:unnamed protein product [Toxocara canis]|uniref:Uncharacterized protein n=1 Tax=Toxocara canis TaxID=6265 RepID=A0A183VHM0_TOXCA|nr:unnamed protein product [Toxocara canis]
MSCVPSRTRCRGHATVRALPSHLLQGLRQGVQQPSQGVFLSTRFCASSYSSLHLPTHQLNEARKMLLSFHTHICDERNAMTQCELHSGADEDDT